MTILRWLLAVAIVAVTGVYGAIALFSDMMGGYPFWQLCLLIAATHVVPAIAVGALVPRRWYVALAAAWGGLAIDGIPLVLFLGRPDGGYPNGAYPGSPVLGFAVIPLSLLVGGYIGRGIAGFRNGRSRLRQKLGRQETSPGRSPNPPPGARRGARSEPGDRPA